MFLEWAEGFEKNELTKDKFIKISKPQENESLDDIWKPIFAVGFNKNLELDQVKKKEGILNKRLEYYLFEFSVAHTI